jgi:arylsulfatase A-like enzyme/Tfp pilus assembly protein PilF
MFLSFLRRSLLLLVAGSSLLAYAVPPNIVLITLDTTRADRMGFLGSTRGLTPNLDGLAREAVVFTHAYSQVPLTTASHATILTGTYPQFHKVNDAGVALAKSVPYAPAILRAAGYQTAAFVGAVILDPTAGAPGFGRGFDTYDAGFRTRNAGESRYSTLERRGSEVVAHALAWIDKHPRGPFFVWIHLYDPHAPYDPPEPFRGKYANAYDGEIAYLDSVVGKLLEQLRAKKLYDGALVAVMADHGEALGEHGERGHGIFLYDPTIHVPLVIKLPGSHSAGERVDARVGLVDVLPTLLQATGVAVPKSVQGESLLGLMSQKQRAGALSTVAQGRSAPPEQAAAERPAYAETDYPQRAFGWSPLRALRSGKYLFVSAPKAELYDQTSDAAEEHDLAASSSAVAGTLAAQLDKFRQQTRSSLTAPSSSLSPDQEEKLRALGYVSGGGDHKGGGTEAAGADPKDKIEIANLMTEANLLVEEDQYQQAIAKFQQVVAKDAGVWSAYSALGAAWTSVGNLAQAVPALRKAVELRPESVTAHYGLGMALFQTGDLKSAAPEFEAAVGGAPESADMHYSLASVYVRINRFADAKKELEAALRLKPAFYAANLMLGQIYVSVEKNAAAALPYLQKAEKAQPDSADAHGLLAQAYGMMGRKIDAEREKELIGKR